MTGRVMTNVKIFIVRSQQDNSIGGDCVFLNEQRAKSYAEYMENLYVDSIVLPFIGKHVSFVRIYKGFDYFPYMHDVCYKSQLYPSVAQAKESDAWKQIENLVTKNPEKFNVHDNKICSRTVFGDDWCYGDIMEGKFSAEIINLKVV